MQGRPNVLVLTFTRALTEFLRTGCYTDGNEIFPPELLKTYDSWQRNLHKEHKVGLPEDDGSLDGWRPRLAESTLTILKDSSTPTLDCIFVDEGQDLIAEEIELVRNSARNVFVVGDDRQRIYEAGAGLETLRAALPGHLEHALPFHYRLVREICEMADRIKVSSGQESLAATQHYNGPTPGRISVNGPLSRSAQLAAITENLRNQVRVYGDLINQGDRLGVIVPRKDDRVTALDHLSSQPGLEDKCQIVRARDGSRADTHQTALDPEKPILIMTAPGSKGLEFRAVQWIFCDELDRYYTDELYYTVVTRAKTSLDIYCTKKIPQPIARSYAPRGGDIW
jgi:DNA helicase IV